MSRRVDHAAEAQGMLATVACSATEATGDDEVRIVLAEAQVHATLALVEQQRLANLIALGSYRVGPNEYPVLRHLVIEPVGENGVAPVAALREALGL